ncbi:unnamed protein product [Urochloa humidicola]
MGGAASCVMPQNGKVLLDKGKTIAAERIPSTGASRRPVPWAWAPENMRERQVHSTSPRARHGELCWGNLFGGGWKRKQESSKAGWSHSWRG